MSKIGSHNSMSYLKPSKWWMKPFHFIARCQRISITEQYDLGIRLFDIRVKYDPNTRQWTFAHGFMDFKGTTPDEVFKTLNSFGEKVYVRLILEYNKPVNNIESISLLFAKQCSLWCASYPNLSFFEFRRKYDWRRLYEPFSLEEPSFYQAVSSMTGTIIDDWCPWLYARIHNRDNRNQGTSNEYLLIDFVDM